MFKKKTSIDIFQKLLLIVGLSILIFGYFMINNIFKAEGEILSWDLLQTMFLWLVMVVFIILLSIAEDIKTSIFLEQIEELKKIRQELRKKGKKS